VQLNEGSDEEEDEEEKNNFFLKHFQNKQKEKLEKTKNKQEVLSFNIGNQSFFVSQLIDIMFGGKF